MMRHHDGIPYYGIFSITGYAMYMRPFRPGRGCGGNCSPETGLLTGAPPEERS